MALQVGQKDAREHSVFSRTAYELDGQLFLQESVMTPNGEMKEVWKRGKHALTH